MTKQLFSIGQTVMIILIEDQLVAPDNIHGNLSYWQNRAGTITHITPVDCGGTPSHLFTVKFPNKEQGDFSSEELQTV